jgi:hypothetical protein
MHAGLVAAVADIDLQRMERPAPDRGERNPLEQWPSVAHVPAPGSAAKLAQLDVPVTLTSRPLWDKLV